MTQQPTATCLTCGQVKVVSQAHICPGPYEWRRLMRARAQVALELEQEKLRWPPLTR